MKQLISILFIVLTFGHQSIKAQQDEITRTFDSYIEATKSDNSEEQLEFYHPEIFNFFPKDSVLWGFEMMKIDQIITVENEKLISISETYTESNIQYALLEFSENMTMDLLYMKGEGGMAYAISLMINEFKKQHGEENVHFDEEHYKVEIMIINEFYAILDPKLEGWKFLPKEENTKNIVEQVIPERIRENI